MNKHIVILFSCFLFCIDARTQNLVPNSSFEIVDTCYDLAAGIYWGYVPPWNTPTTGSPDAFNTCVSIPTFSVPSNNFGFQYPHTGNGYGGFSTWHTVIPNGAREYIQVKLDTDLVSMKKYCISFYINHSNRSRIATNNLGMYFSDTSTYIQTHSPLAFNPQINDTNIINDDSLWTLVYGQYTAHGGEQYIIIGNFFVDSLTDTTHVHWGTSTFDEAYYYIDDVNVHCCSCDSLDHTGVNEIGEEEWKIEPNPATNELRIKNEEFKINKIILYNVLGEMMYKENLPNAEITIDVSTYPKGVYFVSCLINNQISIKKFVKM